MIKAILIDDEQHNLDNLSALLKAYCPQVFVVGKASNAQQARDLISKEQPQLLFLDIHMPIENGFDLLRNLPARNFEVIFVTAYDQYAIQAMRFTAIDYLLKPVDIAELQSAVDRAIKQIGLKQGNQQLENLMQLLKNQANKDEQRIALSTAKETRFVRTDEIVRCESSNNYTSFHLSDGEELLVSRPIYEYEDLLSGYGFIRCHQSHLVNKRFVKSWKRDLGDFLLLVGGFEVPVSRGKKEEVRSLLHAT